MFRYMYNPVWRYVDIYCGDRKITTINYVDSLEDAHRVAAMVYGKHTQS